MSLLRAARLIDVLQHLLSAAGLVLTSGTSPAAPPAYRAGVAKVDITPDHPIRLNGFGGRRTESEGVYQRIHARALAIDTGDGKPAVILTVDVLGMPADLYDSLAARLTKKIGLAKDRLAVAATHTHTGPMLSGANPTLFGAPIPTEHLAAIDRYTPVFLDRLESAAVTAVNDLRPATISWGVGSVWFAANRYGNEITFEPGFQNIGFWHGANDHVTWAVKLDKAATFDVNLEYACATDSAGSAFALDGATPTVDGKIESTSGWDNYRTVKVGVVSLPAGVGNLTVRRAGLLRGALFDLRTVYLVPEGTKPK